MSTIKSLGVLLGAAALSASLATSQESARSAPATPEDRGTVVLRSDLDGDGEIGEATAIRERIRAYRQRHGVNGRLTSEHMLDRSRWGYARWFQAAEKARTGDIGEGGWVSLGPTNGAGRCTAIVPHPFIEGTLIAGAGGGGVWRTTDGGATWAPLTDGLSDLSVGALAYAPSDPDVVYLGSGEGGYATDFIPGIGLLRSEDGGDTWAMLGEPSEVPSSSFFALLVDPEDPDRLFAATTEGLLFSSDGGASWESRICDDRILGVTEILRSSSDPQRLYTAVWCTGTCPEGLGRHMRSEDGGLTWTPMTAGLPDTSYNDANLNRSSLTVQPSNDQVLYTGFAVSTEDAVESRIFRSDDGGDSWQDTGYQGLYLGQQGWYDNTITVHPDDPDVVIAGGVWYEVSADGGATWTTLNPYESGDGLGTDTIPHVDAHDLQWQGDTVWLANDGGIFRSTDGGLTWSARNTGLVTRQYYGIALDPIVRDRILGGTQDNGTDLRVEPAGNAWLDVIPGDGFDCAINPFMSDLMYGTAFWTRIFRSTTGGAGEWTDISPPLGAGPFPFMTTLVMRPDAPWVLYTGTGDLWRSIDAGDSWQAMPKYVTNGEWGGSTISAIAVSAADPEAIMVAKRRLLLTSNDGGESWRREITDTIVNNIEVSPFDARKAFACLAQTDSGTDQLLRTDDGGDTWQASSDGLPPFAVQVARWDPVDPAVVYAGTDVGMYRSEDGGLSWAAFGDGLPAASVHDIRILPDRSRMVIATHGRGIWELQLATPANTRPTIEITEPADGTGALMGEVVQFAATASDADGDDLDVTWLLGGPWEAVAGGSGTGQLSSSTEHLFGVRGRHMVGASVRDSRGGSAFDLIQVEVSEPADACATARVVSPAGPFPVSIVTENRTARTEASDPIVPCVAGGDEFGRWGTLWFELTPAETAVYSVSTCGSDPDTVLSAWTGPSCGPYAEVDCNDDDENVHCWGERTNSRLELALEAGSTYRFMVGAWDWDTRGVVRFNVDCATCAAQTPRQLAVLPAAAHDGGWEGTSWVTDLELLNPGEVPVTAELGFRSASHTTTTPVTLTIAPGSVSTAADAVATLLQASGSGSVRMLTSGELLVASRTFNTTPDGTFGQGIPALSDSAALAPGSTARLIGLASNPQYRTNIGFAVLDDQPARMVIELFDRNGQLLAALDERFGGWKQVGRAFSATGRHDLEAASALVHNRSAAAEVLVYASVVDEISGDPVLVLPADEAPAGTPLWIAAAARGQGSSGSDWQSDMVLANTSETDLDVTVELVRPAGQTPVPAATIAVPAGTSVARNDVLQTLFGTSGSGALILTPDAGTLAATSRTFSKADGGTFGQSIPAVLEERAVSTGSTGMLLQLRQGDGYRTNLGLVNIAHLPIVVLASFRDQDGALLGSKTYRVEARSWQQDGDAPPPGSSFATVHSTTIGARFLAYVSVLDNASNDPVYEAARLRRSQ